MGKVLEKCHGKYCQGKLFTAVFKFGFTLVFSKAVEGLVSHLLKDFCDF